MKKEKEVLDLDTGKITKNQCKLILNTLPMDLTFVDQDNLVTFFNNNKEQIFERNKNILGRLVENCHPDKSVHRVLEIIDKFKKKTLNQAEFWLKMDNRLIYIRYFPVFNKNNEYEGVLEVTQDITDIKNIEGEKYLLDK